MRFAPEPQKHLPSPKPGTQYPRQNRLRETTPSRAPLLLAAVKFRKILFSGHLSALIEKVKQRASLGPKQDSYKRVFRHSERERNWGRGNSSPLLSRKAAMGRLSFYTVDESYVDYLSPFAPHLFHNAVKQLQDKICKNASTLYRHKLDNGASTKLAARCNDFLLLEKACRDYEKQS